MPRFADIDWNSPYLASRALVWVPLAFGVWSVLLGSDANWDLYNYHLYNAFAYLNGKLSIDFAPGGMQNFFNPALDIPYYLAITTLPPVLVGFGMGLLHGLNFVLLFQICRGMLPGLPMEDRQRIPLFLALAGCLTANFLSELGNTMGDNLTALFCLAAALLIVRAWPSLGEAGRRRLPPLLVAGVLAGIAAGLKLTNASYALALCLALLVYPTAIRGRLLMAFMFGIGVLCGMAASAGFWFHSMWLSFGNPLFPMFGNHFPNQLAATISVADASWVPREWWRQLAWPFIISADARAAGQIGFRQVIWAIVYPLLLAFALKAGWTRLRGAQDRASPLHLFLMVFVAIGFVLWMKLFGVYRYLVAVELLAPLLVFVLLSALLPYRAARRSALLLVGLAVAVVVLGGVATWGHNSWSRHPYYVEMPVLAEPAKTTVLITEGDPPWSWLAAQFPPAVAFTQIEGNFPQGPEFTPHIRRMVSQRGGAAYALFAAAYDSTPDRAERMRRTAETLGFTQTVSRCTRLAWLATTLKLKAEVRMQDSPNETVACTLESTRKPESGMEAKHAAEREQASRILARHGFSMGTGACTLHRSGIGDEVRLFHWCAVQMGADRRS